MGIRIFYFSVITVIGAVIQLLACSSGSIAASLVSAGVISIIAHGLWKLSDLHSKPFSRQLVPAGGALAGIVAGTVIRFLQGGLNPLNWVAIPVAVLISGASIWFGSERHS